MNDVASHQVGNSHTTRKVYSGDVDMVIFPSIGEAEFWSYTLCHHSGA